MTFGPSASLGQRGFEGGRSSTESTSWGSLHPRVDHTGRQFPKEGGSHLPGLLPARLGFAAEGTGPLAVAAAPGDALRPRAQQPLDWSHRGPGPPSTQELFLLSRVQGRLHRPHLLPPARHQHVFLLSVPLSAARHPHPGRSQRQAGVGCESRICKDAAGQASASHVSICRKDTSLSRHQRTRGYVGARPGGSCWHLEGRGHGCC